MEKTTALCLIALILIASIATLSVQETQGPFMFSQAKSMIKTKPLSELADGSQRTPGDKPYLVPNNFKANKVANPSALPLGLDPAIQNRKSLLQTRAPLINFPGIGSNGGSAPPDPTGAVGPNHYVQMVNRQYRIWDKEGTPLIPPTNLATLFGSGAGDPITLYDKFADR